MREEFEHPTLPGMSKTEILNNMGKEDLVNHILTLSKKAQNLVLDMELASDTLEGVYGVTVAEVLRERENGEQT